jgi:hypothetical protein
MSAAPRAASFEMRSKFPFIATAGGVVKEEEATQAGRQTDPDV